MALKQSHRSNVPAFIVMEVMRAAAEREASKQAVYHLEVGQPGTGAPKKVIEAAKHALDTDKIGYTVALGIPELREAIATHYKSDYCVDVASDDVIVTTGSSTGFLLSFLSAFDPGDRVALAAPGYPCYRHILNMLGVEPVLLETGPEDRYQPSPDLLKQAMQNGKLDGLILASPSNPSGTMLDDAELKALIEFCQEHGIRLVSDEIYQGISYGRNFQTALSHTKEAIIINSFSKYFSMTGWRLGWMVMPKDLKRQIESMAQNLFISAPTLSQVAAVAAFDAKEELEQNICNYAKNREVLLNALPELGFKKLAPSDGAFYIYADVSDLTDDSVTFCQRILKETGVAVTPGLDFDPFNGHHTMRFSFAAGHDEIIGAIEALRNWKR
ncbi:pyridoxal phosphate-dependent aminotransferase [Curvivirga aplysinae]|uniref:pyridoxal phosphate-dependent aminotransferase n=1 Tax=Curvivirga aplysinae TaxID=2529852 RepID=UPI0012BCE0BB|nr:pyridoxal phosphate-dependent aminotransferase [Curvivirga aplysinae]MTI10487.1 pyridoxal phosphate-dependent aminotransferase [Curvivirga aplysinae]